MSTVLYSTSASSYPTQPLFEMRRLFDYAVCVHPSCPTHLIPISTPYLASSIPPKRSHSSTQRFSPYAKRISEENSKSIQESFAQSPILFDCLSTGKSPENVEIKRKTPSPCIKKNEYQTLPQSKITDIVLKTVNFFKYSKVTKSLCGVEMLSLLDRCWLEIFLLFVVQEIPLSNHAIWSSVDDTKATSGSSNSFEILTTWKLLQRCQTLKLSSWEFELLRDLLFLDRVNHSKLTSDINEDIFQALTNNSHNIVDYQSEKKCDQLRLSHIFLNVYGLRGIKAEAVENIFLLPASGSAKDLKETIFSLMREEKEE